MTSRLDRILLGSLNIPFGHIKAEKLADKQTDQKVCLLDESNSKSEAVRLAVRT